MRPVSERYARAELGGGLVVTTEHVPTARSISIGVWVRAGSVTEPPHRMGVSHLIEHMVFKGTPTRSAREIALALERVGGSLDAYTTREHTSYQARVLPENADLALDILADIVLNPLFRERDLELEREVVLEEIATVEDTPDDLVFDLHARRLWGTHPYGYSILGSRQSVATIDRVALAEAHDARYRRPNIMVGAVGAVEHGAFTQRIRELFSEARNGTHAPASPALPALEPRLESVARDSAQSHLVLGTRTFGHGDPRRYGLILLSNAFGGGMSSRLFQRVREELGLAYAVYSFQSFYAAAGMSGVYVGTRPDWTQRAMETILHEFARLAADGLSTDELADIKGQVKGQIVLALESNGSRLHRLAGTELYGEPFRTAEEVMACVDAVTRAQVAELAAEFFAPERQVGLRLGPEA
jgi:predicted Zn-dependent peptidase